MSKIDLVVPDLGNFDEVAIVDVLIKPGDKIEIDTPLVTLETDKATMDVPSTAIGTVTEVLVQKGGKIGKGGVIARVEGDFRAGRPCQARASSGCRACCESAVSGARAGRTATRGAAGRPRSPRVRSSPTCRTTGKHSC